jgi:uncharacterized protein (DUF58 family)
MRLTRNGMLVLALIAMTLFASLASGNNLLYLLYACMVTALLVSAIHLRGGLKPIQVEARFPEVVFRDTPFSLTLRVTNKGRLAAYGLRLCREGVSQPVGALQPGKSCEVPLRIRLPHRGYNALEGLTLESEFPFGLLKRKQTVTDLSGLAYPKPREVRSPRELEADISAAGVLRPKKGGGDELYGLHEFNENDDARLINWKLSARTSKILVNEYAERGGSRVTVRVEAGSETLIDEAASACKHFIDSGAEVRLETAESQVDYGKGLLHLDRLLQALALLGPGKKPRSAQVPPGPSASPPPPAAAAALNHLGAVIIYGALFLIDEINPALLLALAPAFPLAWWMDFGRGRRLPEFLWNTASLFVLAYVLLFAWRVHGVTLANTHLLLYILVNRLLAPKGSYETRQMFLILFLAFFLVSGQTISLWYFALFLLYAAFAGAWLMLTSSGEKKLPVPASIAVILYASSLCTAGLVFAATPRLEPLRRMNPFIAMGLDKRRPQKEFVVQFSERVSLGFFGRLKKSGARVMRVKPSSNKAPAPFIRIRGTALDTFNGRGWSKDPEDFVYRIGNSAYETHDGRAIAQPHGNELIFPGRSRGKGLRMMEFTVLPLNSKVLFTFGGAARVETDTLQSAFFDHTDSTYFGTRYISGLRYRVYAGDGAVRGYAPYIPGYGRMLRERFLQLPDGMDHRIQELAERVTRESRTTPQKIGAIVEYLNRGYGYSTYSDDADRDLADFLFDDKGGNCEYFATAAAIMLRTVKVPTRLVTGFLAADWNEYGNFYDVRQGQAHAWTEAYIDGFGWVTVDATPAAGSLSSRTYAFYERMRRYFDAVQFRWYRHIIGYDSFVQRNTFMRLRSGLLGDRFEKWGEQALRIAGVWAVILGVLLALREGWRRWQRPRPDAWAQAKALLAKVGLEAREHQTPREFAAYVEKKRPDLKDLGRIAQLHYRQRYSGRRGEELALEAALKQLAERLTSS